MKVYLDSYDELASNYQNVSPYRQRSVSMPIGALPEYFKL